MTLTDKEREYLANAPDFDDDFNKRMQNIKYQQEWLKVSLEDFLEDGDVDEFIRSLTYVVQARGRGEITRLAKELKMDRSNLSEIINGKTKPQLGTVLKLINGLGYDYEINLKEKKNRKKRA